MPDVLECLVECPRHAALAGFSQPYCSSNIFLFSRGTLATVMTKATMSLMSRKPTKHYFLFLLSNLALVILSLKPPSLINAFSRDFIC